MDENSPLTLIDTIHSSDHNISRKEKNAVDKGVIGSRSIENKSNTVPNPASIIRDPPKKTVRWNPDIGKIRHIHRKDMEEVERENVWYNKSDDKLILQMAKVTVMMMMKGEPCDDVEYCSRGLEGKVPVESKKRAKNKKRVHKAVHREQNLQRLEGAKNTKQIANASFEHTIDISTKALDTAIEDERDVQEYLNDIRTHRDDWMKFVPSQLIESLPSSEQ